MLGLRKEEKTRATFILPSFGRSEVFFKIMKGDEIFRIKEKAVSHTLIKKAKFTIGLSNNIKNKNNNNNNNNNNKTKFHY